MKVNTKALYLAMAKKQMTRKELAVASGLGVSTLGNLHKEIRPKTLGKLAAALGCTPEELMEMGGDSDENPPPMRIRS